jgi:intracellular sulfur oxidation DsrE/DsrF family protein
MFHRHLVSALLLTCLSGLALAGPPRTGPVVEGFGPAFESPEGAYNLAPDTHYKVRLDVAGSGKSPSGRNHALESAARFLNMHVQRGIDAENLDFALIVHGAATRDLLSDAAYRSRYGEGNPNTALLAALDKAGVDIFLCAQSAAHKQFTWDEFNSAVTIAVSAMTAHVRLESEGYAVIPF